MSSRGNTLAGPSFFVFARHDARARSLASICAKLGEVALANDVDDARRQLSQQHRYFVSVLISVEHNDPAALGLLDDLPRVQPATVVICSAPSAAIINGTFERGVGLLCESAVPRMLPPFLRKAMATHAARGEHAAALDEVRRRKQLTPREATILQLAVDGAKRSDIALALGITEGTAKWHIRSLLGKCDARSLTELSCNFLRMARDFDPADLQRLRGEDVDRRL